MICYQEYNTKSPLNGLAAKWVEQNAALLPIDTRNVAPPAMNSNPPPPPVETPAPIEQAPSTGTPASAAPATEDPWSQKISIS